MHLNLSSQRRQTIFVIITFTHRVISLITFVRYLPVHTVTSVMSNSATPWSLCLPGFSLHGILQARVLEWVAMPYSRRASQPRDQTCISCVSCIVRWVVYQLSHLGNVPRAFNFSDLILTTPRFVSQLLPYDFLLLSWKFPSSASCVEALISHVPYLHGVLSHL